MLDIGWQELLVIGALALIVVGPKDLPGLLRSLGQWVGKMRGMAREFQRSMNDAARDADMANIRELNQLKNDISSNLDFKAQASKAQSFLNSEPKVEKTDASPEAAAPAAPEASAEPAQESLAAEKAETSTTAEPAPATEPDTKATGT